MQKRKNFAKGYGERALELKQLYERGLSTDVISVRTGISRTHVKRLLKNVGTKTRTKQQWANLKASAYVPQIIPHLAYIYGVYLGDGCIFRDRLLLQVTESAFARSFADALLHLGVGTGHVGYTTAPQRRARKPLYVVSVNAKGLTTWLLSQATAALPDLFPFDFLRGLFESEGYWSGNQLGVVCNTEEWIVRRCEHLLLKAGYHPRFAVRTTPAGKPFFRLFLYRKAEQSRFIEEVRPCIRQANPQVSRGNGIRVPRKLQRLRSDEPCK